VRGSAPGAAGKKKQVQEIRKKKNSYDFIIKNKNLKLKLSNHTGLSELCCFGSASDKLEHENLLSGGCAIQ